MQSLTLERQGRSLLAFLVALVATLLVTACAQEPADSEDPAPVAAEAADHDGDTHAGDAHDGDDHHGEALPLPKRLAFMSGHVEAGLALYRAGEPTMAGTHLLHPVSETHAAEREGLDDLGFDGALFETVSEALDAGLPASEIEPQLVAAEANLAMLAEKAPGDPKEIILYLMDTVVEEYAIGVPESTVTDPGEYQDAFGFTKVAIQRAAVFEGEAGDQLRTALDELLALWPDAPVPPENPTPAVEINQQVDLVRAAVAALG
ncbi:MAG: hypothetical protein AAGE94_03495 [Acidobacteriota bacterium]